MKAILFPGQGSQFNQMGLDFYNQYPEYKETFDLLSNEEKEVWLNDKDKINETEYAQKILYLNQAGIMNIIKKQYQINEDVNYLGFSLGEYQALLQAGLYDINTGIEIINKRSEFMAEVKSDYNLYAGMGITMDKLYEGMQLLEYKNIKIYPSNYNTEKQIIIAFKEEDKEEVESTLKLLGLKRLIALKTSGPFHTMEYEEASNKFKKYLDNINIEVNNQNIYLNLTGNKYDGENIKQVMQEQMTNGVLFYPAIKRMISDGINTFVEVGSKSVLTAMIKKIDKNVKVISVETIEDLDKLEEVWDKK